MLKQVISWWRRRQRSIDIAILWPSICQKARTETQARDAFLVHALNDEAWSNLSTTDIVNAVAKLEWPGIRASLATEKEG